MITMADQFLSDLRSFQPTTSVKGRIVRLWESIDPNRPNTLLSLDFLATDAQLNARIWYNAILTDFIEALKSMTNIVKVRLHNKTYDIKKRDLYIEVLSGNNLKVVLYADKAEEINEDHLLDEVITSVIVLAATTVKKYMNTFYLAFCSATKIYIDPDIPKTAAFKQRREGGRICRLTPGFAADARGRRTERRNRERGAAAGARERRPSRHQIRHRLGESRLVPRRKEKFAGGEGTRPSTPPDLSPEGRADPGQLRRHRLGKPAVRVRWREIACRYSIQLIMQDSTGQMGLVTFGKVAKKLVGASITKLATLNTIHRMTLLGPVKALINQTRIFVIGLTLKAVKTRILNYKLFNCDVIANPEPPTPTSTSIVASLTPPLTIEQPEKQLFPSPISTQVVRELFSKNTPQEGSIQKTRAYVREQDSLFERGDPDPPIQQQRWDLFDSNEAFPSLRSVTLAFSRNSHAMVSSEPEELLVWVETTLAQDFYHNSEREQVRHLLEKRESTSDNHASARQRVEWPRADLFGYIIQVESGVTGTAV
ncbi:Uncharacterized protein TCM_038148 [Theobroma cacao]|uniref:Uncharacterized protein n=1 Tax=Theobroma cacao TaxID=3641 RepID=A0A061GP71_THECC|nr:Uncharacterized protein TCM_038148 [Theobroma cacao]